MNTVLVSMDLIRTSIDNRSLDELECKRCESCLYIHQPDEQLVDRLIGTCPDCFAWYLIDAEKGIMALLPDEADLRDAE
jgi:hypothetical protein